MVLKKRAELLTKEFLGLILGAVAVFVLFLLARNILFSSSYDKVDKTSEAYMNIFEDQLEVVNSGGLGRFSISQKDSSVEYYLVYFGSGKSPSYSGIGEGNFIHFNDGQNVVCLCSLKEEESNCKYCKSLKAPVLLSGEDVKWHLEFSEELEMSFEEGHYSFRKVGDVA